MASCLLCGTQDNLTTAYGRPDLMQELTGHPYQNADLCKDCRKRFYDNPAETMRELRERRRR